MVNVAILGFGTVGSGVAEVIEMNAAKLSAKAGDSINVKYIVDIRDMPESPFASKMIKDFSIVEADPEIAIVVETIGGATVAYDFTKRSLIAGKSVISSNKELVAKHGYELLTIAKEKGVNYFFEAAVGGGIPIIRPLDTCLAANEISEVYGILNGTTNYILTEMINNGASFESALKQAQKLGFAEADPTADVEGHDACRKICILSSIAFGHHLYPDNIPTTGISGITSEDVAIAAKAGYKIKLLGRSVKTRDGKVRAYVAPHLISLGNILSGTDGVMNGIVVCGNAVGKTMFYGPGAGKLPTASAVVADVVDAAKHLGTRKSFSWGDKEAALEGCSCELKTKWYVRLMSGCSINAELIADDGDFAAFITAELNEKEVKLLIGDLEAKSVLRVIE